MLAAEAHRRLDRLRPARDKEGAVQPGAAERRELLRQGDVGGTFELAGMSERRRVRLRLHGGEHPLVAVPQIGGDRAGADVDRAPPRLVLEPDALGPADARAARRLGRQGEGLDAEPAHIILHCGTLGP
jgi:hypothetical protein